MEQNYVTVTLCIQGELDGRICWALDRRRDDAAGAMLTRDHVYNGLDDEEKAMTERSPVMLPEIMPPRYTDEPGAAIDDEVSPLAPPRVLRSTDHWRRHASE